jgi:hypothetical protein
MKLDPADMGMGIHEHIGTLTLRRAVLAVGRGRSGLAEALWALGLLALRRLRGELVLVWTIGHLEHPPQETTESEHNVFE